MKRLILAFFCILLMTVPTFAQEDTSLVRDPIALAVDYRGYDGSIYVPPLPETYAVSDTAEFWVAKTTSPTPVRITAHLAAVAPDAYVWLEDGIERGDAALGTVAQNVGSLWRVIRLRANYIQPVPLPVQGDTSSFVDTTDLLPVPDVDGDPRLHLLYATDLREDFAFNPVDSMPTPLAPSESTNEREVLYLNTTPYTGVRLDDPLYFVGIIRALYAVTMNTNVQGQAAWLTEALGNNVLMQIQQTTLAANDINAYFAAPETPFIRPSTFANRGAVNAAQQMFLGYLAQRFGTPVFRDLFLSSGYGFSAIDAALTAGDFIDLTTGENPTARDLFADFLVANVVNAEIGDGRYVQRATPLADGQFPLLNPIASFPYQVAGGSLPQFGASYYLYLSDAAPERYGIVFDGAEITPRLAIHPQDAERPTDDEFYWSGISANERRTLTRTFDLVDADAPELTFSAWYDLSDGWNYVYVSVSTDGGETWSILTPEYAGDAENVIGIEPRNPHGAAYGVGLTGISNPAGVQPFPIIGVVIQGDGITLGEVSPNGPADQAGILPGDRVIGYDSAEWTTTPDIIGLLSRYNPGDTLNLYIQRGGQRLDVPIVLGAHPTRVRQPIPMWLPYRVDLSDYVGSAIQLRFDVVTLPGRADHGIALDGIRIAAIDYADDGTHLDEWTADGWTQTTNEVEQDWLVQAVTIGSQDNPPRVRRLLDWNADTADGVWTIDLAPAEAMLVIVSPVMDATDEAGLYTLTITPAE